MPVSCPICGESHGVRFRFTNGDNDFYRCSKCNLMFVHPLPGYDENKELYDEISKDLYVRSYRLSGDFSDGSLAMHRARVRWVLARKPSGRLCELGCSTGSFLQVARDAGFDVVGVDLSAPSARYAREELGLAVTTGTLHDAAYPPASFDVVYSWHAVEHVWNPNEVVAEICRILKPDGIVVLGVPNGACLSLRISGARYPHVHRGHLLYFSPRSMGEVLIKHGLEVEQLWTQGWDKVALFLALGLLRFKLSPQSYEELTAARADLGKGWSRVHLAPIRLPLALLNPVVERLGFGDNLICIARKRDRARTGAVAYRGK